MTYAEFLEMTEATPVDLKVLGALLKDAQNEGHRLQAILDMFMSLSVPEHFDGDVQEVYSDGVKEILANNHGKGMMVYAPMVWALTPDLGNSISIRSNSL